MKKSVKNKKVVRKLLKDKLLAAVNRVLTNNQSELTNKMEKLVKKSLKPISRRVKKQKRTAAKQITK
jgi:Txe/YoeB family toxin of Txe-Axe toxin-antitoxin module